MSEKEELTIIFETISIINEALDDDKFVTYRLEEDGTNSILHNFFEEFFFDDELAKMIGEILFDNLMNRGVTNWEFGCL